MFKINQIEHQKNLELIKEVNNYIDIDCVFLYEIAQNSETIRFYKNPDEGTLIMRIVGDKFSVVEKTEAEFENAVKEEFEAVNNVLKFLEISAKSVLVLQKARFNVASKLLQEDDE